MLLEDAQATNIPVHFNIPYSMDWNEASALEEILCSSKSEGVPPTVADDKITTKTSSVQLCQFPKVKQKHV